MHLSALALLAAAVHHHGPITLDYATEDDNLDGQCGTYDTRTATAILDRRRPFEEALTCVLETAVPPERVLLSFDGGGAAVPEIGHLMPEQPAARPALRIVDDTGRGSA